MTFDYKKSAIRTIKIEKQSIELLTNKIDERFEKACELIMTCKGRVVVTGMGKSGHIGNKIAATLASTGTPAFFVHPAEASHGDMGMITSGDVVIALSNSGTTAEVATLIPLLKRLQVPLISMTGQDSSLLAKAADVNLDVSVQQEACPLDLAPTSSTTVTLVMGDALAIALLEAKGFTAEDFAFSHPGGALGRKLLLKIDDIMHKDDAIPVVQSGTSLKDGLLEMSQKGLGMTAIVNEQGELIGIFTDGDLRRALDNNLDVHQTTIDQLMTSNCKTIPVGILAAEAMNIMENAKISALIVVDDVNKPIGAVNIHDLLKAGIA